MHSPSWRAIFSHNVCICLAPLSKIILLWLLLSSWFSLQYAFFPLCWTVQHLKGSVLLNCPWFCCFCQFPISTANKCLILSEGFYSASIQQSQFCTFMVTMTCHWDSTLRQYRFFPFFFTCKMHLFGPCLLMKRTSL